jgi:DNA-directed RNA polymerase subunit N (RpoN/RPB10)
MTEPTAPVMPRTECFNCGTPYGGVHPSHKRLVRDGVIEPCIEREAAGTEALRAALNKYGVHKYEADGTPCQMDIGSGHKGVLPVCTCGLDAALASTPSTPDTCNGCECHGGTEVASCTHCASLWATPDTGLTADLDVERLTRAMNLTGNPTLFAKRWAEQVAAEYARLTEADR